MRISYWSSDVFSSDLIINDKSVGVIEEDPERNIVKIAKPIGVIGALSPTTNPEATPVIKAISAVKGRNSIIVAPHPRAKLNNKMRSEEHTSELQSLMRNSYAVFCLKQKKKKACKP